MVSLFSSPFSLRLFLTFVWPRRVSVRPVRHIDCDAAESYSAFVSPFPSKPLDALGPREAHAILYPDFPLGRVFYLSIHSFDDCVQEVTRAKHVSLRIPYAHTQFGARSFVHSFARSQERQCPRKPLCARKQHRSRQKQLRVRGTYPGKLRRAPSRSAIARKSGSFGGFVDALSSALSWCSLLYARSLPSSSAYSLTRLLCSVRRVLCSCCCWPARALAALPVVRCRRVAATAATATTVSSSSRRWSWCLCVGGTLRGARLCSVVAMSSSSSPSPSPSLQQQVVYASPSFVWVYCLLPCVISPVRLLRFYVAYCLLSRASPFLATTTTTTTNAGCSSSHRCCYCCCCCSSPQPHTQQQLPLHRHPPSPCRLARRFC